MTRPTATDQRPQPKLFFEAPARVRNGRFGMRPGRIILTSQDLFFVNELHAKLFDIPLHTIQDIYFRKNHRIIEVTENGRTHYVYPGHYARWKSVLLVLGTFAGFVPGVIVYFSLVHPAHERNQALTKKLQIALAKHAITFD